MVAGVGNAIIAPLQNAGAARASGSAAHIPEFSIEKAREVESQNNEIAGFDSQISSPIAPAGLNALIQSQKPENKALDGDEQTLSGNNTEDTDNEDRTENTENNEVSGEDETPLEAEASETAPQNSAQAALKGGSAGGNEKPNELTEEEEEEVEELQQRDQEVRQHEQAHKTVGGSYAGSIQYETVTGPDGKEYAVGGEVDIDVSAVPNNPEATIRKMEVVERAALAPAEPSSKDIQVARTAQQTRAQAQAELKEKKEQELKESSGAEDSKNATPLEELQNDQTAALNPASEQENNEVDEQAQLVSILFS